MRRIAIIVLSCVITLGAVVMFARARWLEPAMTQGRTLFEHRNIIQGFLAKPPPPQKPSVLFMGDSTIMGRPKNPSWAHHVGMRLGRQGISPLYEFYPGHDVFHHYCVSGAFLEWEPDVVVIVVNYRLMRAKRRDGSATNLCSFLPPRQLTRSLALPWHDRGLSLVRLGLTQALRLEPVEETVLFFEGLRRLFADRFMGPSASAAGRRRMRAVGRSATNYDQPLSLHHPLVRVLGALVGEAHRAGAHVLVVVSPIPIHRMERAVPYDAVVWRHRHEVLRSVVTTAGGELLDLHDLLGTPGFRDIAGHMSPAGHALVTNAVSPTIHRMLGLEAPEPMVVPDAPSDAAP